MSGKGTIHDELAQMKKDLEKTYGKVSFERAESEEICPLPLDFIDEEYRKMVDALVATAEKKTLRIAIKKALKTIKKKKEETDPYSFDMFHNALAYCRANKKKTRDGDTKLRKFLKKIKKRFSLKNLRSSFYSLIEPKYKHIELDKPEGYVLLRISQLRDYGSQEGGIGQAERFEELLGAIVPPKKKIRFEVAVGNNETDLKFYVSVPEEHVENTKVQICRLYPNAQINETTYASIFTPGNHNSFQKIVQGGFVGLSINTYKKSELIHLSSLLGALSNFQSMGEGVGYQVVLRQIRRAFRKEDRYKRSKNDPEILAVNTVMDRLEKGWPWLFVYQGTRKEFFKALFKAVMKKNLAQKDEEGKVKKEEEKISSIKEKMSKNLYRVNIRLVISAKEKGSVDTALAQIKNVFPAFYLHGNTGLSLTKEDPEKAVFGYSFRCISGTLASLYNSEEVATLFHFPNESLGIKNIAREKTKQVSAPTTLGDEGLFLGDNVFHGRSREIYIPQRDRMRHTYLIGQTGTGKTSLLKTMSRQDIESGKGLCIIDPHGDFVEDMLASVPKERIDDVIVLDPSEVANPIGLNMLEYDRNRPQERSLITDEMLAIFKQLFLEESMGPMFEQVFRNSLLLLMEGSIKEPATLLDVPKVLTNRVYRQWLLGNIKTPPVLDFWNEEIAHVRGKGSLENMVPYVTSKFNNFLANDYIRPIISQPYSTFSFRKIMDRQQMLFVKLPKGKIGELNMQLFGMLVVGKLALAAFSRDDIKEEERKPFFLYVDEFQNFTSDSVGAILSEARKYNLGLILAHQYMKQIKPNIQDAVLGNVGSTIAFRVGIGDAKTLTDKFHPVFTSLDIAETENFNCIVSMLSRNMPQEPFTMKIRKPKETFPEIREKLIQYVAFKRRVEQGTEIMPIEMAR